MPSASSKQHRFMSAVAHNPTFAKKAGVPQSVGKDFAAADKGRKFGRSSRAGINIQNTQHGKMDMPFKSLRRYAGLKGGGEMNQAKMSDKMKMMMQKRVRPAMRPAMAGGMPPGMKKGGMPMKDGKPAFMMKKKMMGGGMHKMPDGKMMKDSAMKKGGAIKRFNGEYDSDVRTPQGDFIMGGLGDRTIAETNAREAGSAIKTKVEPIQKTGSADFNKRFREEMKRFKTEGGDKSFEYDGKQIALEYAKPKAPAPVKPPEERSAKAITGITAYGKARAARDARKFSAAGGMRFADENQNKTAKYAKGGGIESRGKTKGTVIRMASGGSVSSRADGIAQRGKTKFKTY